MGCCCGDDEEPTGPMRYKEERSCTDCLCLLLFIAFWGGFIAVASIAFSVGKPERLIYGTDYLGYRCGDADNVPANFTNMNNTAWQSSVWTENKIVWYPLPYTTESFSFDVIINSGVCVKTCPNLNQTIVDDINANGSDMDAYSQIVSNYLTVYTYGGVTIDNVEVYAPTRQYVMYSSEEFFYRCMPSGLTPAQVKASAEQIPGFTEVSSFFFRGFAETAAAWRVFLITLFITFVIAFVYIFIMRFIVKVLVYVVIFLGFAFLVLCGAAAYNRYQALSDAANEDGSAQNDYVDFYLAAAIISWVAAGLYIILVIFMRKRISLACAIVSISGRVMASAPSLLLLPPCIGIFLLAVCAWALAVGVYLYSAQDFTYKPELIPVFNASQNESFGTNNGYVMVGTQLFVNATTKLNDIEFSRRDLVFYDLFGFLWTMGFINAIGYMTISFVTIFWYYSDLDDSKKAVPVGGVCKGLGWTLRYHLGTLAFGSLIIAIIQFIRILMNYFYKQSKALKENQAAKIIMCIANCIMACFERIVNVISKNAYIMTAITNRAFCCAAKDAFNLVVDNALTLFILNFIVEFVMLLGKLMIVSSAVLIAYLLMKYESLAPGVETYIFPLILIAFGAYFIALLFFSVYSVAVDANFVCYVYDRKANAGTGMYYVPKELEDQISNFDKKAKLEEMQRAQEAQNNPKA